MVDLVIGTIGRQLGRTADRDPLVGVFGVDDGDGRPRVPSKVALFRSTDRRVERHDTIVGVHPDDRVVRRTVLPKRRGGTDVRVLGNEVTLLLCELGHLSLLGSRWTETASEVSLFPRWPF